MADKHMQILANLIKAVTNVADRGTSQESNIEGSEGSSSVSVEETIKRLFPSTEGGQGVAREELYVRGFTTTFELTSSMTEEEIRCILEEKLKDKLCNIAGLKFIFVRAVCNKIIVPSMSKTESFDGRMVKHFAGQGPIYIRALRDISSALMKGHWKRIEPDCSASDDESDDNASVKSPVHEPCTGPLHPPSPDISTTRLSSEPSTSATNEPSCSRNLIACPTCHNAFPAGEIELHADACAEEKYGSVNENQYNNIMEEFDDIYEIENTSHVETPTINVYDNDEIPNDDILTPENHKQKIKDAIYRLNKLVPDKQNKYHIRRKTIFDDYVNARVRSKWMQPENKIRVTFVGEKGIDGGGPKREFLS
ncbi:PREDICTED: uncharacterized protein LOC107339408 isoform X2, partial [Paramuricea clavata]